MSTDPREFEHPIDGTGGTVPPLVDVIAEVLTEHEAELDASGDCYTGYCACNQKVPYVDHAAHQARAVMAAISEAGTVEWGVRYGDGDIDGGYLHKSEALTDIERLRQRVRLGYDHVDDHEPMTLLTRRRVDHATDWVSAE